MKTLPNDLSVLGASQIQPHVTVPASDLLPWMIANFQSSRVSSSGSIPAFLDEAQVREVLAPFRTARTSTWLCSGSTVTWMPQ